MILQIKYMANISEPTQKLIQRYQLWQQLLAPKEKISTIHVDEVASKVAAFYEKIRGVIDWREEHLLKTGAIERMLKRNLISNADTKDAAAPLVMDLIRGGIFPNDAIEEVKIKKIQQIIDKYTSIINSSQDHPGKSRLSLYNWLMSIAACEIEEVLSLSIREVALIDYMFESMKEKIRIKEGIIYKETIGEEEKNLQIYIAVQRALFKLDSQVISYHLLKHKYFFWGSPNEEQLKKLSHDIYFIREQINRDLNHPLADKIYQICERYDTPYLIIGDIVSENPQKAQKEISVPANLEKLAVRAYNLRLKTLKSRLARAAVYATISIFITKIVLALLLEIPLDKYLFGDFNALAIAIDALLPPLLMFLLIITIKPPKKENLELVIMELMKIIYPRKTEDIYEIKIGKKRRPILTFFVGLVYFISFLISFGIIVLLLYQLNFPIISYFIFIIFISLIAFAGTRLRQRAKELHVSKEKEGFSTMLLDLFALPFIQLGNWFTKSWKKYNIIAVFFNALIDMPFTIFVEFIEQWRYFLKEKKEKIH
jgi:hypothetical protein